MSGMICSQLFPIADNYFRNCYHPAGTASMGKVVEGDLHVYRVEGLRIVDASVIPTPIAAHIQVAVYALAEQAADIIFETWRDR